MIIDELITDAYIITKASTFQKRVFRTWANIKRPDPVYDMLAFDTETTGLTFGVPSFLHTPGGDIKVYNIKVFGISMCMKYDEKMVLVWGRLGSELFDECAKLLTMRGPKVGHNVRYDWKVCEVNHLKLAPSIHDTLTMARLVWNRRRSFDLKQLTKIVCPDMFGYEDELKAVHRNIKSSYTRAGYPKGYANYSFIPDDLCGWYGRIDAFVTWMLNLRLMPEIQEEHRLVYRREIRTMEVVKDIELRGVQFDRHRARKEVYKLKKKIPVLEAKLIELAGVEFNPGSPKQLLEVLLNMGMPKKYLTIVEKGEKKITTEKKTLQKAIVKRRRRKLTVFGDTLFSLRSCTKLCNTYIEKLLIRARYNNGIVFCNINPVDTRTGRMSSSDPNLQNIPRSSTGVDEKVGNPVRKCFGCRPGYFNMYVDYSQMEMWLFAIIAQELRMLAALQQGADIHATVSYDIYGKDAFDKKGDKKLILINDKLVTKRIDSLNRFKCKKVSFGIIYGMGFKALAVEIKSSEPEAYELKQNYLDTYPRAREFNIECADEIKRIGYVTGIFGKRYNIRLSDAYKAINALVQGGCAQILKIALHEIDLFLAHLGSYRGKRIRMILLIHDEIVFEVPLEAMDDMNWILPILISMMVEIRVLLNMGITLKADPCYTLTNWSDKKHVPSIWLPGE